MVTVKYAQCQQEYGSVAEYTCHIELNVLCHHYMLNRMLPGYTVSLWMSTGENYYTHQSEHIVNN